MKVMRKKQIGNDPGNSSGVNVKRKSVRLVLGGIVRWLLGTLSLAVFYYILLAMFFSTEEEKRLMEENRMYEEKYIAMVEQNKMNAEVIKGLQIRDNDIYKQIFHSAPPSIDPAHSLDYEFDVDSIYSRSITENAAAKSRALLEDASKVNDNFSRVFEVLGRSDVAVPPMCAPLEDLGYAQIGASVGQKINPFTKVKTEHTGLDLIVGQGSPVMATAEGVVVEVIYRKKGLGNTVVISHAGGYETRYSHLSDIKVGRGRKVRKGEVVGEVGISGRSFAPHLHYEVWRDGKMEDPVNYLFTCLSPKEYTNVLYMAVHTEQSLD